MLNERQTEPEKKPRSGSFLTGFGCVILGLGIVVLGFIGSILVKYDFSVGQFIVGVLVILALSAAYDKWRGAK